MRRGRSRGPCRGTAFWSRYGVSIRFRLLPRFSKLHISRLRVLDGLCLLASRERDWTFSPSFGYSLHSESRPIGTFQTVSSTTAAVRHRRWLLDYGNDSVWPASDGVFASATSVEILLFALTASTPNEPTGDALPAVSGAKGCLRIPLFSLPQAYDADEGVRQ